MVAREDRRMAGAGLGRGMALIAVAEHGPRRDPREAIGELRAIFIEQVGGELVDREDDEQLGRMRLCLWLGGGCSGDKRGGKANDEFAHEIPIVPLRRQGPRRGAIAALTRWSRLPPRAGAQAYDSFARSRSLTSCGLALPAIAFIVWPTKKPNNASFPPLYCATLSVLSASTSSIAWSIAPVSLVCLSPRLSTIAAAPSLLSSMISNTCLAIVPEMVPSATSPSSSAAWAGVTGLRSIVSPRRLSAPNSSATTQFAPCFGSTPASSRASNQRAVSTSAVRTPALYGVIPRPS